MAAPKIKPAILVKDIMTQALVVTPAMKLWEVAELYISRGISGAPVVDSSGGLLSVLGEGATLRLAANNGLNATVSHCLPQMTPAKDIIKVTAHDTFADVYKLFLHHNIHRIPVVDGNGHVHGIISRSMILKMFVEAHYGKKLASR